MLGSLSVLLIKRGDFSTSSPSQQYLRSQSRMSFASLCAICRNIYHITRSQGLDLAISLREGATEV